MTPNHSVDSSRRWYARLLGLYPREFRNEYGASMLQVFNDQCRSAQHDNGTRGMVFLWVRTLVDLAASVLREHIASPSASSGLLEAVPNKPLPWKGVALVLIPCLVFFAGQIGQLAGQDWFFLLTRRAAYFLIIPVLVVWLFTRKFPIWGLIPLGMFFRNFINIGSNIEYVISKTQSVIADPSRPPLARLYQAYPWVMDFQANIIGLLRTHLTEIRILAATILLSSMVFLFIRIARRRGYPRAARAWTGIFIMLTLVDSSIFSGFIIYLKEYSWNPATMIGSGDFPRMLDNISSLVYSNFTIDFGFLILILLGALLAWRHGRLALLLPLGYLIPTIIVGRLDYDPRMPYLLFWASVVVLAYRVLVAWIAPIWVVRSASAQAQRRAGTIGLLAAIGILVIAHIGYMFANFALYGWKVDISFFYYTVSPELITLAGIALAVSLYKAENPINSAIRKNPIASGEIEG
jgi:hypothetical protein